MDWQIKLTDEKNREDYLKNTVYKIEKELRVNGFEGFSNYYKGEGDSGWYISEECSFYSNRESRREDFEIIKKVISRYGDFDIFVMADNQDFVFAWSLFYRYYHDDKSEKYFMRY